MKVCMVEDKTVVAWYCSVSRNPVRFKSLNQADDVSARNPGGHLLERVTERSDTFRYGFSHFSSPSIVPQLSKCLEFEAIRGDQTDQRICI